MTEFKHDVCIVLTTAPHSPIAPHALKLAQALQAEQIAFGVFFYQDAVYYANRLLWLPSDEYSLQHAWQRLNIDLPVCVSAALRRGITDTDNALRHSLKGNNLAEGFRLTGLGELADLMAQSKRAVHF